MCVLGLRAGDALHDGPRPLDRKLRLSEDEAYNAMRKMAMSRKKRLGDVARLVIDMADIIG